MNFLFASTARGLEELLKTELEALGAQACLVVQGGVHFDGDARLLYQSRLASRILLPLGECKVYSDLDLYLGVQSIDWASLFAPNATFAAHFSGLNGIIRNSQYGAMKVKDAIVDAFIRQNLTRPDVDWGMSDLRINVWLHKEMASIELDLSGEGLHLRGYREGSGMAPIKENLVAAIVMCSGWQPRTPLVDPMCGSGTLLIEGAMIATDRAPGLHRRHWGFFGWSQYDETLWKSVKSEAQVRARRAGLADVIRFMVGDVTALINPQPEGSRGTVISNPPYGECLDIEPALIALHSMLGRIMKTQFGGWNLSLFSASPALLSCMQLCAYRQFNAKNGLLDCVQKNYALADIPSGGSVTAQIAEDYANRLRKNSKKVDKWARQEGIECYRLYDADLPDYNVAVDRYADWVVVQEYVPPKTIEPAKARQRLFDVIAVTLSVLNVPPNKLVLKTRERQKGNSQYQKMGEKGEFMEVREFTACLLVNLTDYLDTGLFLDHRIARRMLGQMSKGKDFLNLFSYTGSASVHAGLGSARSTTTVDMSRTYLEWAEKNLRLNGLRGRAHRLIQADCLSWIRESAEQFDLIFIDPPTFSNSKRMTVSFDVQRDHLELLKGLKRLLRSGGTIMFSNNKRCFRLDREGIAALGLQAREITQKTLSMDFARNSQIHNCWLMTHAG